MSKRNWEHETKYHPENWGDRWSWMIQQLWPVYWEQKLLEPWTEWTTQKMLVNCTVWQWGGPRDKDLLGLLLENTGSFLCGNFAYTLKRYNLFHTMFGLWAKVSKAALVGDAWMMSYEVKAHILCDHDVFLKRCVGVDLQFKKFGDHPSSWHWSTPWQLGVSIGVTLR